MGIMKKSKFIEHSLIRALDFFRDSVFTEEYSQANGFLQFIDPRIKLISFAVILLVTALVRRPEVVFMIYLFSLLLAQLSKINLPYFIRRVWIFIPLFSLVIAIPALFKTFSPGRVIFLNITKQGLSGATLFVLRVLSSVSFTILLVLTTAHISLLKALRALGVPQIFVNTFMMCYRYIYIFIKIVEETYLAIKSRLINNLKNKKARKVIAWRISTLWEKSRIMSEEVYLAMLCRGYSGEPRLSVKFKLRPVDFWWLFLVLIVSSLIFYLDGKRII